MEAYDILKIARHSTRATSRTYITHLLTNFCELHGDRRYGDDKAIISGIGLLKNMPITVIAQEKGSTVNEKMERNFGSSHPEGYRKALRQIRMAEKFNRPILCIVDTSGAYCGIGAEERGQGQAISENLYTLFTIKVPILTLIIGEGGSGGALALAIADEVWMLEHAIYSVITPEGCASILWKDVSKTPQACNSLKITSKDMLDMEIIERIIPENTSLTDQMELLKDSIYDKFMELKQIESQELLNRRYEKYRKIGR